MTRENTDEKFLGFSVIILDLPVALKPIMLEELQNMVIITDFIVSRKTVIIS